MNKYGEANSGSMTRMIQVNLDTQNVDQNEAQEWANEIVNVMQIWRWQM